MLIKCCICQEDTDAQIIVSEKKIGAPEVVIEELLLQCIEDKLPNYLSREACLCNYCEVKLLQFYDATLSVIARRNEFKERIKPLVQTKEISELDKIELVSEEEFSILDFDWNSGSSNSSYSIHSFSDASDIDEDFVLPKQNRKKKIVTAKSNNKRRNIQLQKTEDTVTNKEPDPNRYCQECEAEFPTGDVYKLHIKKYHPRNILKNANFYCDECSTELSTEELYRDHIQSVHNRSCEFLCDMCGRAFNTFTQFTAHKATHNTHSCTICGKTLLHRRGLLKHIKRHSAEKIHQCVECGNKYASKHSLKQHMSIHSETGDFECSICGMCFSTAWHLKRHQCSHTGEKRHVCTVCGQSLSNSRGLRRHMLGHTGEKMHQCLLCSKKFSTSSTLKQHLIIHSDGKKYACGECDMRFRSAWHLRRHQGRHQTKGLN